MLKWLNLQSIKRVGLLEPLVVRKKNGKYEVVCGIRRYRALGHIGNGGKVPCNVVDVNDHEAMVLSFTENFERVGFSPVEEARFFYKALEIKEITNISNFHQHSPEITQLAKDLPASFSISVSPTWAPSWQSMFWDFANCAIRFDLNNPPHLEIFIFKISQASLSINLFASDKLHIDSSTIIGIPVAFFSLCKPLISSLPKGCSTAVILNFCSLSRLEMAC